MMQKRVLLLLISIDASLFLCEGIVRYCKLAPVMLDSHIIYSMYFVSNPDLCYKMKSDEPHYLNSDGYRDDEFVVEKDEEMIRIVMLGDSITYGYPVKRDETFSSLLEDQLNSSSETKFDVMNFGVGGYNIVSEVETLKVYGLRYKPDIVVLNLFWNDDELYSYDYYNFFWKNAATSIQKKWVYEYYARSRIGIKRLLLRSHLFSFIWARTARFETENEEERRNVLQPRITYTPDILLEKITELNELVRQHDLKLLICMHPILDYDSAEPHPTYARVGKIASQLDIPLLDLLPYYKEKAADPTFFLADKKDTYHPNQKGHLLIAQTLHEKLISMGVIPER